VELKALLLKLIKAEARVGAMFPTPNDIVACRFAFWAAEQLPELMSRSAYARLLVEYELTVGPLPEWAQIPKEDCDFIK
jgi:hypothetical protein